MPEVRMSLEEYQQLLNLTALEQSATTRTVRKAAKKKVKRVGKKDPKMAKAMKEANQRLRTKSGKLRKGKTQADVARLAHKIRRQKYA